MATEMLPEAGPDREVVRSPTLWFGVLAGPVLWFFQLYVNYQWEEVLACSPANTKPGQVLGLDVRTWILLVNTVVTAVTLVALAVAVRNYRRTGATEEGGVRTISGGSRRPCRGDTPRPPGEHHRSVAHWMAFAGIANSVLFLLLIVGQYGPPLLLKPCQKL
jgi:hypothetical protein